MVRAFAVPRRTSPCTDSCLGGTSGLYGVREPVPAGRDTSIRDLQRGPAHQAEHPTGDAPMTSRQTTERMIAPDALILISATLGSPQGRSQAESRSRTADRAATTPADDTTQVSATAADAVRRSIPMARDPHLPTSAHPDPPSAPRPAPAGRPTFLSQRTALILYIAVSAGVAIGVLTFFAKKSYPDAVLAGIFAAGACTVGLHNLIE
jgi:hypothetical protein